MAWHITDPKVIERGPYLVVGAYATYEGEDEGPAWGAASGEFFRRKDEVPNRIGDAILGFLYRPHRDDPTIGEDVRAVFMGVEVSSLADLPAGLSVTRFSGGRFVTVESRAQTEGDAGMGVGDAVHTLERWVKEHGYREGDSCFCFSYESAPRPPYVEHVYMKFEEP
jgi:hypothetical protein